MSLQTGGGDIYQISIPAEIWHYIFLLATAVACPGHSDEHDRTDVEITLKVTNLSTFLGDFALKYNLALVSHKFRALSEPIRYRNIVCKDFETYTKILSETSIANPTVARGSYVRGILLSMRTEDNRRGQALEMFGPAMQLFSTCQKLEAVFFHHANLDVDTFHSLVQSLPSSVKVFSLPGFTDIRVSKNYYLDLLNLRTLILTGSNRTLTGWGTTMPLVLSYRALETLYISTEFTVSETPFLPSLKHLTIQFHRSFGAVPIWVSDILHVSRHQLVTLCLETPPNSIVRIHGGGLLPLNESFARWGQLQGLTIHPTKSGQHLVQSSIIHPELRYIGFVFDDETLDVPTFTSFWNMFSKQASFPKIDHLVIIHPHEFLEPMERIQEICGQDPRLTFQCNWGVRTL
ncbi:hypothetical protein CPB86DRAFT_828525 [Serendipita vermifera]|nr:hypothetical protein CPB86DRAFT_828525 [Serendipita vermifera]